MAEEKTFTNLELGNWAALAANALRGFEYAHEVYAGLSKAEKELQNLEEEKTALKDEIKFIREQHGKEVAAMKLEIAALTKDRAAAVKATEEAQEALVQSAKDELARLKAANAQEKAEQESWKNKCIQETAALNAQAAEAEKRLADAQVNLQAIKDKL
jgi:formylmethanofuran dehydrogenase subunit E-like metal-binding protein